MKNEKNKKGRRQEPDAAPPEEARQEPAAIPAGETRQEPAEVVGVRFKEAG